MNSRSILSLAILLMAGGCAGYRVGPTNGLEARSKSVQVNLFVNETLEPRLTEAVAFALRRRVQQEGTYALATQDDGEIILSGAITRFDRDGVSFQPSDVLTPRDYALSMIARVKAVERASGKTLLDAEVSGRALVRAGANLDTAERQAIPIMAQDLAYNLTSLLTDGTW
ncbi:MAG: LPS assembly lipoprotein LptE [Verrucomicrobiota bacterium]|nr:LPS assembly lipoprotein LptE [Verrucomicrobiota bacterium]